MYEGEALLHSYLLGQLPEQERVQLEEQYFARDDLLDELRLAEAELIDAYVAGELPQSLRERFEEHYLASPRGRQKTEFAQALRRFVSQGSRRREEESAWVAALSRMASSSWQMARVLPVLKAAIGLGVVATAVWLFLQSNRIRNELARIQTEQTSLQRQAAALERRVSEEEGRTDQVTRDIVRERQAWEALEAQRAAEKEQESRTASLLLPAGLLRDTSAVPTLFLAPGAKQVRLALALEEDEQMRYGVVVLSAEGAQVWQRRPLNSRPVAGGRAVVVLLSARLLPEGHYVVRLSGTSGKGSWEDIQHYFFRVRRP